MNIQNRIARLMVALTFVLNLNACYPGSWGQSGLQFQAGANASAGGQMFAGPGFGAPPLGSRHCLSLAGAIHSAIYLGNPPLAVAACGMIKEVVINMPVRGYVAIRIGGVFPPVLSGNMPAVSPTNLFTGGDWRPVPALPAGRHIVKIVQFDPEPITVDGVFFAPTGKEYGIDKTLLEGPAGFGVLNESTARTTGAIRGSTRS